VHHINVIFLLTVAPYLGKHPLLVVVVRGNDIRIVSLLIPCKHPEDTLPFRDHRLDATMAASVRIVHVRITCAVIQNNRHVVRNRHRHARDLLDRIEHVDHAVVATRTSSTPAPAGRNGGTFAERYGIRFHRFLQKQSHGDAEEYADGQFVQNRAATHGTFCAMVSGALHSLYSSHLA